MHLTRYYLERNMDQVLEEIKKMNDKLEQGEKENKEWKNEVKTKIDKILVEVDGTKSKIQENKQRIERLEDEKRRKNVIIYGLAEAELERREDLEAKVFDILINKMGSTIKPEEVDYITRMGKDKNRAKPRGVLIILTTLRRKLDLLALKRNLKNTPFILAEHFSKEIQEKRKPLLEEANKLRKEGKYAVVKFDKLVQGERRTKDLGQKGTPGGAQGTLKKIKGTKRKPKTSPSIGSDGNNTQDGAEKKKTTKKYRQESNSGDKEYFTDSDEFMEKNDNELDNSDDSVKSVISNFTQEEAKKDD